MMELDLDFFNNLWEFWLLLDLPLYFKIRHLPLMTKLNFDWMDLDVFEINHLWEWTLPDWRIPLDHPHENWFGNALNFRENRELNHEKQSPHEVL